MKNHQIYQNFNFRGIVSFNFKHLRMFSQLFFSNWLSYNPIYFITTKAKCLKDWQGVYHYVLCAMLYFVILTLSDPGYFRQLTIQGVALKAPPYDLENYCVNLHHIIHVNFTRCLWHDPIGIFKKFAILTILQRFQNKK